MTNDSEFITPDDGEPDDDDLSVSSLEEPADARPRRRLPAIPGGDALRVVWRASGLVAFVGLIAIVVVALAPHVPRPAQTRYVPRYIALEAPSNTARCLVGSSWSHDSRQIAAVLSYACRAPYLGQGPPQRNLYLYDAATGREAASYDLDSAVSNALAQVGLVPAGATAFTVDYFATAWSPGDRLLAAQFAVYGQNLADVGVAVVTLTGAARGHIRVVIGTPTPGNAPDSGLVPIPVERWDLQLGSHSTIYLAPALAYRWLPSDVLVTDEALPTSASAPAPTGTATPSGNPIGGRTFSLWRTGDISLVNATTCFADETTTQPLAAPYAELSLTSIVWSPDGRYLLDVSVPSRLPSLAAAPPSEQGESNPCVSGPAPDQLPIAPIHDKGLQSALALLDPHGGNTLTLAWSPDGKRLAVATLVSAQGVGSVAVYDCVTGARLQRFTGDQFQTDAAMNGIARNPIWSPDGAHLLLAISAPVSKLVILGPQALGG